jgi:hypothetical protein
MYFEKFPLVRYDISKDGNLRLATDVLRRVAFREKIIEEGALFEEYYIEEGETPEVVAEKVYGDPEMHWIIMLFNKVIDPKYDFPLSEAQLESYLDKVYPGKAYYLDSNTTNTPVTSNFVKGADVFFNLDKGLVRDWDPVTQKLSLEQETGTVGSGDVLTSLDKDGNEFTTRVKRIVEFQRLGLHHFENSGQTAEINGYASPPDADGVQVPLGQTGSGFGSAVTMSQTVLQGYLNSVTPTTHTIKTISDVAFEENDERRKISILKQRYVPQVIDEFKRIMKEMI